MGPPSRVRITESVEAEPTYLMRLWEIPFAAPDRFGDI
jgi:hypothetical protein